MGSPIDIDEVDERKRPPMSEVERLLACTKKAERLLDWSPKHTGRDGLREGLRKTAAWFTEPANSRALPRRRLHIVSLSRCL